jgi:arabinose-5-phosphate isomerase
MDMHNLSFFDENKIITNGKNVLDLEAQALSYLSKSLDDNFVKAVKTLYAPDSRVIVSGMGKSGHVGKKIAATMSSVGQPAFFVHPAEASHGDLGMITKNDKLLLISNNGESYELRSIIDYAKRFDIPIVSITSNPKSTLAKFSKVVLLLPKVAEACPMGLAPTTSTTMTIAMGDALAISILHMRDFNHTDFKMFHPGGNLGTQLALVRDYMHTQDKLPVINSENLMDECLIKMSYCGFGCVGVIDDQNNLIGIVTDGDLRRHMNHDLLKQKVKEIMTKNPITIFPDILMVEALSIMNDKSITSLFVIKKTEHADDIKKNPIGILHIHDCLRAGVA